MATISTALFVAVPFISITLHELVLRRYEVDHLTLPIVTANSIVYSILIYYAGFLDATTIISVFWTTLWIYIGAYRAFFHPLRKYPGPFGARLSKWYTVGKVIGTRWHWHKVQQDLQKQYGDYVRTGPRELSIFNPDAVQSVLGFQSKTSKGPFYDVMEKSLHLNRDKPWHRQRRKVWDNAMKTSLSNFAPRIEELCDQLLIRLRQTNGSPILLLETMTYFSYDAMSALAFGKPMGFTKGESSEVADSILNTFTQGVSALGIMYHMPWLMNALGVLTSLAGPMKDWTDWSVSQMKARMAVSSYYSCDNHVWLTFSTAQRCTRGSDRGVDHCHKQRCCGSGPSVRRITSHHQRRQRNNIYSPNLHLYAARYASPLHARYP